jgi:feruloyl esterase
LTLNKKPLALAQNPIIFFAMDTPLRRYEFSERLAGILGESQRDLRFRVTLLVTGGLIPPGSRGPGSPLTTPHYAAELLIGVLAAPQQVHTVDAVRCYRELQPTRITVSLPAPGIRLGARAPGTALRLADLPLLPPGNDRPFGTAVADLIEQARDRSTRDDLAQTLVGIWIARGFPAAAVQLAQWRGQHRTVLSQLYELPRDSRPPAWLDPDRGGASDPGLLHSVFLPVSKLVAISRLTAPDQERTPPVLDDLGRTLASLADLARNRRNRRPWEKFLDVARGAEAFTDKIEAEESHLIEVVGFGANPGNLRMLMYLPEALPAGAPLVVVLHGCTQTAHSYDDGTGWTTLADRYGFAVLLPEQRRGNNPLRCFNWFRADDNSRDAGEALSIREMVGYMARTHGVDSARVFVTGLSAGGAMTAVMLATYPDVFAGGAVASGVPYRCANGLQEAFDCIFQGKVLPAADWGARVRAATQHKGPWPKLSVWHGDADSTVKPVNAEEIIKQWTNVHSLPAKATAEQNIDGHRRYVWRNAAGEDVIESFSIAGMPHGQAINPHGPDGCGRAGPFLHDLGISSAEHIARFWGLTAHRRENVSPRRPRQRERAGGEAPKAAAASSLSEVVVVDSQGRARSERGGGKRERRRSPGAPPLGGIDLQGILSKSFEIAGLAAKGGVGAGGSPGGLDVQQIIAKSMELARLAAASRDSGAGEPADRATSRANEPGEAGGPIIDGEAVEIDPNRTVTRALADAGVLRTTRELPPSPAPAVAASSAAPIEAIAADGWSLVAADAAGEHGPILFGHASSGLGDGLGEQTKTLSLALALGTHPRLSYTRRLDLRAAVNPLTAAAFRVRIGDVIIDEAQATGMDYAESTWTDRTDLDLGRFAGETCTLSFDVIANANVCVEISAKAWLAQVTVADAALQGT